MPERAPVLPRHRRHPVRTAVLDVAAKLGSAITLAALLVVGATTAGLTAPEPGPQVVTFEIAGP